MASLGENSHNQILKVVVLSFFWSGKLGVKVCESPQGVRSFDLKGPKQEIFPEELLPHLCPGTSGTSGTGRGLIFLTFPMPCNKLPATFEAL